MSHNIELKYAVAVIVHKDKVFLGLANCDDERHNTWCFIGGSIDEGEDCISAAIRESYEESGLICKAVNSVVTTHPAKPNAGFVILESDNEEFNMNEEFFEGGWFNLHNLPEDILPINLEILKIFYKTEIKTKDMPDEIEKSIKDEIGKRRNHILKGFSDLDSSKSEALRTKINKLRNERLELISNLDNESDIKVSGNNISDEYQTKLNKIDSELSNLQKQLGDA